MLLPVGKNGRHDGVSAVESEGQFPPRLLIAITIVSREIKASAATHTKSGRKRERARIPVSMSECVENGAL